MKHLADVKYNKVKYPIHLVSSITGDMHVFLIEVDGELYHSSVKYQPEFMHGMDGEKFKFSSLIEEEFVVDIKRILKSKNDR